MKNRIVLWFALFATLAALVLLTWQSRSLPASGQASGVTAQGAPPSPTSGPSQRPVPPRSPAHVGPGAAGVPVVPEAVLGSSDLSAPVSPKANLLREAREVSRSAPVTLPDGRVERVRLVESPSFKYPNLRVVERFARNADGAFDPRAEVIVMVADHLLVDPVRVLTDDEAAALAASVGGRLRARVPLTDHVLLSIPASDPAGLPASAATLAQSPLVAAAEPDFVVSASATIPNDPSFPFLYGMHNTGQTIQSKAGTADADMDVVEAWDMTTGSREVVVAVIDTGVDITHPDLAGNVARNADEIPSNGLDDDNNGFIDDVNGWDFSASDNDPADENGHGTHVSGTIAAVGNDGAGVAGVAWRAAILPVRFLDAAGSGATSDAISAVQYSILRGARISNNSWGGNDTGTVLGDAIAAGGNGTLSQIFVAAAGNDNSGTKNYPGAYDMANVLCVAATDNNDKPASFTNYDSEWVDVAAPGVDILSLSPGGGYRYLSGTSMATPAVSGVVALIVSLRPDLPYSTVLDWIKNSVDLLPELTPWSGVKPVATGGRVNAHKALFNNLPDALPTVASWSLDGSGNGIVNPGETITITAVIKNAGRTGATGLTANLTLTPAVSGISIVSGNASLGSLASLEQKIAVFTVAVDSGVATPVELAFDVNLNADGGVTRTGRIPLHVFRQHLVSGSVRTVAGQPVVGAEVRWEGPVSGSVLTGPGGTYAVELVDGTHGITAAKEGFVPSAARYLTVPPSRSAVDFVLGTVDLVPQQSTVSAAARPGGRTQAVLTLTNQGTTPAEFRIREMEYAADTNSTPGGPSYSWVEITGNGTLIPISEYYYNQYDTFNCGPFPIGMRFPFYEGIFESFRLSSHGWMSFTNPSRTVNHNASDLPDADSPENLIAFAWSNFFDSYQPGRFAYPAGSREIYYKQVDPHTFVITSRRMALVEGDLLTSQVVLKSDGTILLQYGPYQKWDGSLTGSYFGAPKTYAAGIQDGQGRRGLAPVFGPNRVIPVDGTVIRMRPVIGAPWLKVGLSGGLIQPNDGTLDLPMTFDATNLPAGVYETKVVLETNDPSAETIEIPVSFTVSSAVSDVTWITPAASAAVTPGGNLTLEVDTGAASVEGVDFYASGSLIGTGTPAGSHHAFTWSNIPAGSWEFEAVVRLADGSRLLTTPRTVSSGSGFRVLLDSLDYGTSAPVLSNTQAVIERIGAVPLNFSTASISTYGGTADVGRAAIEDDGRTIHLGGFARRKIALPYTITPNTVLEFDFLGSGDGSLAADVFGIGMDTDDGIDAWRIFQIWGGKADWGSNRTWANYTEELSDALRPRWRHYRIPIGQHYTGLHGYLVLMQFTQGSQSDISYSRDPDASWRNIILHEDPNASTDYSYAWSISGISGTQAGRELTHQFLNPRSPQISVLATLGSATATAARTLDIPGVPGFAARINFQPAAAPVPFGYVPDSGLVFGHRGNGLTYGWTALNTTAHDGEFSFSSGTQQKDTCIRQTTTQTWEIQVPNGTYQVYAMCGLSFTTARSSQNQLFAEGMKILDRDLSSGSWIDGSVSVTVSDGRLSVTSGRNSAALCYLEIRRIDAPGDLSPVAAISASTLLGEAPLDVNFDASASHSPGGATLVSHTWDFGGGATASGVSPSHSFTVPGLHPVSLTVTDAAGRSTTTSTAIRVLSASVVPYASWIAAQPGIGGSVGAHEDPDHDGLPNLVEYALGTFPTQPSSGARPEVSTDADNHLTLTFTPQVITGLAYTIQTSSDLITWTDHPIPSGSLGAGLPHTFVDSVPVGQGESSKRFARLVIGIL